MENKSGLVMLAAQTLRARAFHEAWRFVSFGSPFGSGRKARDSLGASCLLPVKISAIWYETEQV